MTENLPQINESHLPDNFFLGRDFKETMEIAKFFSESDLIPAHFQKKPANVFIALEMAVRQQMSPLMIMQSIYVVHGRPGFEGKFLIALANRAGWNLEFETEKDAAGNITACTAVSRRNGVITRGPKITMQMVKAEGWDRPKGTQTSKWVTMPELMFRYRAGSYFVNTVCPQLKMGMPTVEEIEDATLDITPEPLAAISEVVETDPEPEPPAKTFEDMVLDWDHPEKNRIHEYLDAFVAFKKVLPEVARVEAVKNWEKFTKSFEKWLKKNPPEPPQAPPAPPAPESNGNAQANGKKIIRGITDAQIDQISELLAAKNQEWGKTLDALGLPAMPLIEFDYDTAQRVIEYLAAK